MLKPPPRDDDGNVIPHDHEEIFDEDYVIRGVIAEYHLVDDGNGGRRLSSQILSSSSKQYDKYQGLSVDLKKLCENDNVDLEKRYKSLNYDGAVQIKAGSFREEQDLKVGYDPLPDNQYHSAVWGKTNRPNSRKNRLLAKLEWLVQAA